MFGPWHRTYCLALGFLGWEALRPCLILPKQGERELGTQQNCPYYMEGYRLLYNTSRSMQFGNKPEVSSPTKDSLDVS